MSLTNPEQTLHPRLPSICPLNIQTIVHRRSAMEALVKDEAFLLRCASTYNWHPLLERCILIKEILSSSPNDDDPMHKSRVAAASHQLQAMDEWQNTTLHLACFHNAPIEVIMSLLEAASAADPPIQITSFLTGDNSTPLLIACATSASTETILALLNPPGSQMIRS